MNQITKKRKLPEDLSNIKKFVHVPKIHASFCDPCMIMDKQANTLPLTILHAENIKDIIFAVASEQKLFYTRQELLEILAQVSKFNKSNFSEPCSYIV